MILLALFAKPLLATLEGTQSGGAVYRRGRLPTRGPPQRGLHRRHRRFDRNHDGGVMALAMKDNVTRR